MNIGRNMVRLQRFELKIRLLGFQDTPDSAPMVPRPSEPKLGGSGLRARAPGPQEPPSLLGNPQNCNPDLRLITPPAQKIELINQKIRRPSRRVRPGLARERKEPERHHPRVQVEMLFVSSYLGVSTL